MRPSLCGGFGKYSFPLSAKDCLCSQIFPELTGKIFVIFEKNPMFAYALHSVFLAAAVSQQYSSRRLTFPHKRRYAQMWGAGGGAASLRE